MIAVAQTKVLALYEIIAFVHARRKKSSVENNSEGTQENFQGLLYEIYIVLFTEDCVPYILHEKTIHAYKFNEAKVPLNETQIFYFSCQPNLMLNGVKSI